MANTITLKGKKISLRKEADAAAAITPGQLLEEDTNGEVQPHSTAGGSAQPAFAIENGMIGDDIDVDYSVGDNVHYRVFNKGAEVYAFLANGENVSIGDLLESDGAGALQAYTAQAVDEGGTGTYTIYDNAIVVKAKEALNNTSGSPSRIKVEVV